MTVHVATIVMMPIMANGQPKATTSMTIAEKMKSTTEPRVNVDASIPNTANYPTIKTYLELEAGSGFTLNHLDQNYVITYSS